MDTVKNHNHDGVAYAAHRYAQLFLDAHQEYKFSCRLLAVANSTDDPQWTKARALKCINRTRRQRKLAKKRLDRIRGREGVA